jgi:4a-hydroxytetrahydrobiopterin dehydratase
VSNTDSPTPNGWNVVDGALHRRLTFADFAAAFAFMTRVAQIAEEEGHHPDWSNSWNVVEISLRSHDAGGVITERDVRLAQRINEVLS